jgi:hypothetical protein
VLLNALKANRLASRNSIERRKRSGMSDKAKVEKVREAVGVFFDAKKLEEAITDLQSAGFEHSEISMLAGEETVKQSLGHIYTDINEDADDPGAPQTAFVAKEGVGDTVHGLLGAFFFTGATVAAGAVVATAGVFGTALIAATAGVAALVGIEGAMAALIGKSEAEYLHEEVDRGHLLLFVRTRDAARESKAVEVLSKHSGYNPHIIEIPHHKSP